MIDDMFPEESHAYQPLAARLRPLTLRDYIGQKHILAEGKPLWEAIEGGQLHSMLFWGPPGVGKTTLARMLADHAGANFVALSAVLSGIKDIRSAAEKAKQQNSNGGSTILFVDEVHRFNKAQQDAFLPYVEDGTLIFVGATTENPSFELNNALLSRSRVYKLRALSIEELISVIQRALDLESSKVEIELTLLTAIAEGADGDARRALNLLELALDLAEEQSGNKCIDRAIIEEVLQSSVRRFDNGGDLFYDQISALHKSVRGSSPDGALYWFAKMIDGGCDPLYIARRVLRMASEDVGNADPRALTIALNAWEVQERLGKPEGELAIAQAVVYIACAPKSNAVYTGYNQVISDISQSPSEEVPIHLRNAPTQFMKNLQHGADYRYAHDEENGFAAGENYLPKNLKDSRYYFPVERGLEKKIALKLSHLRNLDKKSTIRRYD